MDARTINQKYANKDGFKTVLWLGGIIVAVLLFSYLVKGIKAFFNLITGKKTEQELNEKNEKEQDKVEEQVAQAGFKTSTLPKPIAHYAAIADQLEGYMAGLGTKGKEIVDACKVLSKVELQAVYLKFGSRINFDFSNDAGNLFKWFEWEFQSWNPLEYQQKQTLKLIWLSSGLPVTF